MLENGIEAKFFEHPSAVKTQENLQFSVSYTVSNFIADKIIAPYNT